MLGNRKVGLYLIQNGTHHHYTLENCQWSAKYGTTMKDGVKERVKTLRAIIPYDDVKLIPPDVWEGMADKSVKYTLRGNRQDYMVKDDKGVGAYPQLLDDEDVSIISEVVVHDYGSRNLWCIELIGV